MKTFIILCIVVLNCKHAGNNSVTETDSNETILANMKTLQFLMCACL